MWEEAKLPPRPRGILFSLILRVAWLVGIFLVLLPSDLLAEKNLSNVVCREDISAAHREELASKLRKITGWPELKFDRGGILRLGNEDAIDGSRSARELVTKVIYGPNVVVLEDTSKHSDVVFSRVIPGRWIKHAQERRPAFVVQIDFADFERVMGDMQALQAFDLGWAVLHELDHIVNDSRDATALSEAGECEDHINQMRRECNLPQRSDYFFTLSPLSADSDFKTRLVRLAFDQEQAPTNKKKRYWVIWDADVVGGLDEQKLAASR
jgi:hypothetical protein